MWKCSIHQRRSITLINGACTVCAKPREWDFKTKIEAPSESLEASPCFTSTFLSSLVFGVFNYLETGLVLDVSALLPRVINLFDRSNWTRAVGGLEYYRGEFRFFIYLFTPSTCRELKLPSLKRNRKLERSLSFETSDHKAYVSEILEVGWRIDPTNKFMTSAYLDLLV